MWRARQASEPCEPQAGGKEIGGDGRGLAGALAGARLVFPAAAPLDAGCVLPRCRGCVRGRANDLGAAVAAGAVAAFQALGEATGFLLAGRIRRRRRACVRTREAPPSLLLFPARRLLRSLARRLLPTMTGFPGAGGGAPLLMLAPRGAPCSSRPASGDGPPRSCPFDRYRRVVRGSRGVRLGEGGRVLVPVLRRPASQRFVASRRPSARERRQLVARYFLPATLGAARLGTRFASFRVRLFPR